MARHGLRFWGWVSAATHALIGLLLLLKLPGRDIPPPQEAVPVEFVTPDTPAQMARAERELPLPAPPAPQPEPDPTTNAPAEPEVRPTPPSPPPPPPPPPPAPAPTPAPPAPTPPAPPVQAPQPAPTPPAPPPPMPAPPPPTPAPAAQPAPPAPQAPQATTPTPAERPQPQQAQPPLPQPPPPTPAPPQPERTPQPAQPAAPPNPPRATPTQPSTAPPPPRPSQQAGTGRTDPPPRTEERSSSVLSTLERLRASQQQNEAPRARPAPQAGRTAAGGGTPTGNALLTQGEIRGVADRISECWSVDAGMLNLDQITVELRVEIDSGGTIRNVRPASSVPSDPRARAVYESARRALMDVKCSPLPIPREKIPSLANATFRFNPRGLVR